MSENSRAFPFGFGIVADGEEEGRRGSVQRHPGEEEHVVVFGFGAFSHAEQADCGVDGEGVLDVRREERRDGRGRGRIVGFVVAVKRGERGYNDALAVDDAMGMEGAAVGREEGALR